ncbi:3686_t:CDS:2 [Diversispora eburnea]|uniref:3686_t:CDS:1 n=1 Tax=Diversispora eburnea TaxID=1213867 RepID=A0A9N8Z309_9GLOM|nr:3686_t:CDS:2 [Diversispora eburnea]
MRSTRENATFTALSCGHLLHRSCLEEYIIRTVTRFPTCTICPTNIDIIREERTHASGEFNLVRKDQDSGKKASQLSTDTIDGDNNLEYMGELGLLVDTTSTQQENQIAQSRKNLPILKSPIVIDDDNYEQTSSKDTDEGDIVQSLLGELSTPIKGETVEAMIDEDENNKNSAPKNLSILFQKACRCRNACDESKSGRNYLLVLLWERVRGKS